MGVREALAWLKQNNKSNVTMKMDSESVYNVLKASNDANSHFDTLIEDYQVLATNIGKIFLFFSQEIYNLDSSCRS